MEHLKIVITEFLLDLRAQKLRSFLTTFGIIWGTVAIIILVSFGVGFRRQLAVNMHGIGESISIMFPGKTTKSFEGFGTGRGISFTEDDVTLIESHVHEIGAISPEYSKRVTTRLGENILNPLVTGIVPIYGEMRNVIAAPGGRFIDDEDVRNRRRVAVLGDKVEKFLFGDSDPIGKVVRIGETPFIVIGVMVHKTQNSSYNTRDQDRIFIPSSTFSSVFGVIKLTNIVFQPTDPSRSNEVGEQVRAALGKKYRFDPKDMDAVWIWDTAEFDKFMYYFFLGFNIFMGLIGGFTLGVAGIGVANIMFIVVQERVKEIGIKRAVGARRSNILFQFFMETFFIVGIGSAIGFLISLGIIQGLQYIPIKEFVGTPVLSVDVVIATISILAFIGLASGFMPARRAANLDVIECLRT
ncbi:MAG TPA: ABC transporter permease [Bacteroidota bacterium]|nr:ABC transporter permease [Bacteroidota bacterium]